MCSYYRCICEHKCLYVFSPVVSNICVSVIHMPVRALYLPFWIGPWRYHHTHAFAPFVTCVCVCVVIVLSRAYSQANPSQSTLCAHNHLRYHDFGCSQQKADIVLSLSLWYMHRIHTDTHTNTNIIHSHRITGKRKQIFFLLLLSVVLYNTMLAVLSHQFVWIDSWWQFGPEASSYYYVYIHIISTTHPHTERERERQPHTHTHSSSTDLIHNPQSIARKWLRKNSESSFEYTDVSCTHVFCCYPLFLSAKRIKKNILFFSPHGWKSVHGELCVGGS